MDNKYSFKITFILKLFIVCNYKLIPIMNKKIYRGCPVYFAVLTIFKLYNPFLLIANSNL